MKHFLKEFNPTPMNIAKLAAILLVALIVLAIGAQIVAPSLPLAIAPGMPGAHGYGGGSDSSFASEIGYSYATDYADGGYGYATAKPVATPPMAPQPYESAGTATLSARNVLAIKSINPSEPPFPGNTGTTGSTAEDFEVTDYSATIETRKLDSTCASFTDLKAKSYVIFENSNTYDTGCSYTFKVEHAHVDEVLAWLKALDPKSLSENSYTIKKQIDDFTSEEDILKKKLTEIDDTLKSATDAYEEVTRLATQTKDAASLAQIIQSRIQIIQQLTQERININDQLDRLARAKTDQLDRLDYTYFNVSVYENKYIDSRMLGESWKHAIRDVVRVANDAIQGVTINLIALFFIVLQYALYALILLVIAKYGWQTAVKIWKK